MASQPRPNETRSSIGQRAEEWLAINNLTEDEVQVITLPLGMVVVWIERALDAEAKLGQPDDFSHQVTARIFRKPREGA